jgi:peptidyl-prolyl cis-trans isomerase C
MNLKHKFALPLTAGALLLAANTVLAEEETSPAADLGDEVVAQVNGEDISSQQFAIFFQDMSKRQPNMQQNPQQAQSLVFSELLRVFILAQEAEKQALDERKDVQDALMVQKKQFLARMAMLNFLNDYKVDEAEVQKAYEQKLADSPKQEYKARHILVKSEDEADAVIVELDGGADFAELAKEKSIGPSGPSGGDLGWFGSKQMVAPFAEATEAMDKGSYSKEPVETQFGWHVILLEDTREPEPPTLDSMRDQLETQLKQQALRDYVAGLVDGAQIEVNEKYASKPTPAAAEESDEGGEEEKAE